MVHFVNYHPLRRANHAETLDDIVPLHNVEVGLRLETAPQRVYQAPGEEPLEFTWENGRARCVVPEVREHGLVVFE